MNTRRIGIGIVALVLLFVIGWRLCPSAESQYAGKTLTQWLETKNHWDPGFSAAVLSVGAAGLLTLIQTLGKNEPTSQTVLKEWLSGAVKQPDLFALACVKKLRAVDAFSLLGTNAYPAIPQLKALLHGPDLDTSGMAAQALGVVGEQGIRTLIQALNHPQFSVRISALAGLQTFVKNSYGKGFNHQELARRRTASAPHLIAELISQLKDPNETVRQNALMVLGLLREQPETVIPVLLAQVQGTNSPATQAAALHAIGQFGTSGKGAVP